MLLNNRIAKRREICIWLAFSIICALVIVPPWTEIVPVSEDTLPVHRKLWNAPLWSNSISSDFEAKVDYPRMLTEIGVLECLVLALYFTWGRR